MVELNAVEARVLGALMEKEMTTPENYPLSLNALVNACNQKSSRDPVMDLSEADVRGALFALDELRLVRTLAEGRVSKFEHRIRDGLGPAAEHALRRDEFAVLCLLMLRGPQTPAELRARAERLYSFDDNAAVMATLERLGARDEPLTRIMPRQPGAREARWTQLLSAAAMASQGGEADEPSLTALTQRESPSNSPSEGAARRIEQMEQIVHSLEMQFQALDERVRLLERKC